jgi:hypothetical protein
VLGLVSGWFAFKDAASLLCLFAAIAIGYPVGLHSKMQLLSCLDISS